MSRVVFMLIAILMILLPSTLPSEALPVPYCENPDTFQASSKSNDQSYATMNRLVERGWSNVSREERFWTDTITADCSPQVVDGGGGR